MPRPCRMESCDRPADARELCKTHYSRWRLKGDPAVVYEAVPVIERLRRQAQREGDCLVFTGALTASGYGSIRGDASEGSPVLSTHVVACEAAHGAPPTPEHEALHSCDNPPCIEPTHLRWGTQADNIRDAIERGRWVAPTGRWDRPITTTEEHA